MKHTGRRVAIKFLLRKKSRAVRLKLEVDILRKVSHHPQIVELLAVYETEKSVQLVLEMMGGGELFQRIITRGPFSERQAAVATGKLADALHFLHLNGVVHRDIKPENLLLTSRSETTAEVKLTDFGLSRFRESPDQLLTTVAGTWAYTAPEVKIHRQPYGDKVDVWSLGIILYVLLSAYHPFDPTGDAPEAELQSNIRRGEFDFDDPVWEPVSSDAKDLIRCMLVVDPEERFSAADVLRHERLQATGV